MRLSDSILTTIIQGRTKNVNIYRQTTEVKYEIIPKFLISLVFYIVQLYDLKHFFICIESYRKKILLKTMQYHSLSQKFFNIFLF